MNSQRVILFYKFVKLSDPEAVQLWQRELCLRLNLFGRMIIATQGINGTLAGTIDNLKAYRSALNKTEKFKQINFKWSEISSDQEPFPKLSIKVRPELVTLEPDIEFEPNDPTEGLSVADWHQYLADNPNTTVLDARNSYESQIGNFKAKNLITPAIKSFKEIKPIVKELPKDQPVLTYCTGNIRCQYLSAYMKRLGFKTVHHLRGGIMAYGHRYQDKGFWQGKCYSFDRRGKISFSKESDDIASCLNCQTKTSNQTNCRTCNNQIVVCQDCLGQYQCCQ